MLPRESRRIRAEKENQWQKPPLIHQDICREMSVAMQIIRNNQELSLML